MRYMIIFGILIVLFKQLWQPALTFILFFAPIYMWYQRQTRKQYELSRQRLKERYGIQNEEVLQLVVVMNKLLDLNKQQLSLQEKRQKKTLIEKVNQLVSNAGEGYVYFVKEHANGTVKIGKALNPYQRILKGFGVKIPFQLELLYLIRSDKPLVTEKLFHEHFRENQINGEWFRLSQADMDWITKGDYTLEIYESLILEGG